MLKRILRPGGYGMFNFNLQEMLLNIPAIIIGFSFHEFAHAFASDRLGDPTPRNQGRLTFSPLAHIDIIGFVLILVMGFGWAKPVQINPRYYRHPRRDDILVSLAGPATNLVLAIIFTVVLRSIVVFYTEGNRLVSILGDIADHIVWINIILFLFNLIPLPPLDGYHILADIIPSRHYRVLEFLERYSTIILMIIIITPVISYIISPPANFINDLLYTAAGLY